MAVNARLLPTETLAGFGVTVMDCSLTFDGAVTVSDAAPLMPANNAVIVIGPPAVTPVAIPVLLTIVATEVLLEVHATCVVRF